MNRRNRLDLMSYAERAIHHAVQAVEQLGCDVRLTDAVVLLSDARAKVADFVDERPWLAPSDPLAEPAAPAGGGGTP